MNGDNTNLPNEIIQHVTHPLARFLKIEAAAGGLLFLATVLAMTLANSAWSESYINFWEMKIGFQVGSLDITRSLQHWINDALMTLFFFVVALELKRELVLGELRSVRVAMLPFAGAIGGMVFPVLLYFLIMHDQPEVVGWGTVMATDTAFVIGCLALLGSRVSSSLRLFLLSLAIFDDIGAILVVAFGYSGDLNWIALSCGLIGFIIIASIARVGVRSVPLYSILGILIWFCFDASGIHSTMVGVVLGLMTPTSGWVSDTRLRSIFAQVLAYPKGDHWSGDTIERHDLRTASTAARETLSPVERLEMRLHPWVGFAVMPVFALANAGVLVSIETFRQPVVPAVIAGLALGKPIGVFLMSWFAVRLGIARQFAHLSWPVIAAGSLLTGIGFTMSLFVAGLSFDSSSLAAAKIGILIASIISASAGLLALMWLTSRESAEQKIA